MLASMSHCLGMRNFLLLHPRAAFTDSRKCLLLTRCREVTTLSDSAISSDELYSFSCFNARLRLVMNLFHPGMDGELIPDPIEGTGLPL